jgi:hypothetical protein
VLLHLEDPLYRIAAPESMESHHALHVKLIVSQRCKWGFSKIPEHFAGGWGRLQLDPRPAYAAPWRCQLQADRFTEYNPIESHR